MAGRAVVVTGGAGGIGLGVVRAFLEAGDQVMLTDLRQEAAELAVSRLPSEPGARAAALDVRDSRQVELVLDRAWRELGALDILVNCAGIYPSHPVLEMREEEWDAVLDTNLKGCFLTSQAFARRLVAAGRPGRVVNITSGAARRARPGAAHYCTSKAGLEMLTRALALELARHDILVNAVSPGFVEVDSELSPLSEEYVAAIERTIPLRRAGRPQDIAAAVLYLCGADATWITGSSLTVDGGSGAGNASLPLSRR